MLALASSAATLVAEPSSAMAIPNDTLVLSVFSVSVKKLPPVRSSLMSLKAACAAISLQGRPKSGIVLVAFP